MTLDFKVVLQHAIELIDQHKEAEAILSITQQKRAQCVYSVQLLNQEYQDLLVQARIAARSPRQVCAVQQVIAISHALHENFALEKELARGPGLTAVRERNMALAFGLAQKMRAMLELAQDLVHQRNPALLQHIARSKCYLKVISGVLEALVASQSLSTH